MWENIISKEKHIIFLHQKKLKYFIYFISIYTIQLDLTLMFFSKRENARLHTSFFIIRDRYFCTHESFILVQKVGCLNTCVGQLETLFVRPALNGYLFSKSGKDKAPKGEEWAPCSIPCVHDEVAL